MREKLIEILESAESAFYWNSEDKGFVEKIADHLIANGVTIQQWIPVTERLPSDDIPSKMYLCYWNGYIRVCKYWRTRKCFELRGKDVKVTHWMPLPEPPAIDK